MPTWGWLLTALAGAVIVWIVPRLLSFTSHALADAVVDRLEERLQPLWSADLDDATTPILHELRTVRGEVTLNGGGSLKDRVLEMQRTLETLVTDR